MSASDSNWLGTNTFILKKFNSATFPIILYVADQRNIGTNKLAVVRLVNGAQLPFNNDLGFSVATPNPLYVKGNYNVTADGVHYAYLPGFTTTSGSCVPAAPLCDAITILSSAFTDKTSSNTVGTASVSNTVNAAIVAGNVPFHWHKLHQFQRWHTKLPALTGGLERINPGAQHLPRLSLWQSNGHQPVSGIL